MNLKEYKKDIIAISSVFIIVTIITLFLLNIDGKAGAYYVRDVFFYLKSALYYSGWDTGIDTARGLSPLVPMITAIFFKMGFISDVTLMAVSSAFYIFSAIGMYLLLRLRFNEVLSFTGSMILSTFPLMIVWATKGMIDIPGLCLSIWAVYFMILSFKKNIKFLYVAFPLAVLGFFSRYTVIIMMPVLLITFLMVENPFEYIKSNFKHIFGGIISGGVLFALFIGIGKLFNMTFYFVRQGSGIAQATHSTIDTQYNNVFYYFYNLPIYFGNDKFLPYSFKPGRFLITKMEWIGGHPSLIGYLLMAILAIGIILYLIKLFNKENRQIILSQNKLKIGVLLAVFIIGVAVFLLTFIKISIIASVVIISVAVFALYKIFDKVNIEYFKLDFLMILWFVVNFSFFTYHHVKVDRYLITVLPVLAYFIIVSLTLIFEKLKSFKHIEKIKTVAPIALVCLILMSSGVAAMSNTPHTFDNQVHDNFMTAAAEEKAVGNWLAKYDPDYANKTIWADRGGDLSWILKTKVRPVEYFSNSSNFTDELIKENVTYFISMDNKTIGSSYEKLYQNGEVSLYYNKN